MQEPLGNAKWSRDPGIPRSQAEAGNGFFFGFPIDPRDYVLWENFKYEPASAHFLTVAGTRTGKGVSLIIPNLLCYRGSALVIDPKGENAWVTAPRRRELGQAVHIVDPWDEVNRRYGTWVGVNEKVARFNPLSVLVPGSPDFIDQLAYLADALIITKSTKDPYWDDTARELWAGLMAFVVESPAYRDFASLGLARKLLTQSNEALQRTIHAAIGLGDDSVAARKLAQFKDMESITSILSVISSARTQTAFLDNDTLHEGMAESDFSFDDLRQGGKPTTVFLVLPLDKLTTYGQWLRLMVSIAIGAVKKGPLKAASKQSGGNGEAINSRLPTMDEFLRQSREDQLRRELALVPQPPADNWMEIDYCQPGIRKTMRRIRRWIRNKWRERKERRKSKVPWTPWGRRAWAGGMLLGDGERRQLWLKGEVERIDAEKAARVKAIEETGLLPVLFLLDEFGTIGNLSMVSKAYGLMAGMGMTMWAFVQDLNQLRRDYPDEWETFIGNARAMVCFGLGDQFTLEYVSKQLGTRTVRYTTTSGSSSESTKKIGVWSPDEVTGHTTSSNVSEHIVGQPLLSPDQIKRLYVENCLVIGPGSC